MTTTTETMISKADLSREEWLAIRRTGIGSSDAATVLGMNPYQTPYDLYQIKREEIPEPDLSDKETVTLGNDLEDYVAQRFSTAKGRKVRRDNYIRRHPNHPYVLANLDRYALIEGGGTPEILECKTAWGYAVVFGEEWGDGIDEVPERYILQVMHQMIVDGAIKGFTHKRGHLAALLGTGKVRFYEIPFDAELAAYMLSEYHKFWNCVVNGTPPEVVSIEDAKKRYPKAVENSLEATPEIVSLVAEGRIADADLKSAKAHLDNVKARIMAFMGESNKLMRNGTPLVTWNEVNKAEYTVKATTYRNFTFCKPPKG